MRFGRSVSKRSSAVGVLLTPHTNDQPTSGEEFSNNNNIQRPQRTICSIILKLGGQGLAPCRIKSKSSMGCSGSKDATTNLVHQPTKPETNVYITKANETVEESAGGCLSGQQKTTSILESDTLTPEFQYDQYGNKVDVATGGRVWSEEYYRARKEADFHANQRGQCFERSKKAFEEGHKKEAKELSDEGKDHGRKMEEANSRAAEEILKPQRLETSPKIDLHGLLVAEAVDACRQFVRAAKLAGNFQQLEIITGAGHHSAKEKGPVIKPAIVELCKIEKWQLQATPDNEGSFTLIL